MVKSDLLPILRQTGSDDLTADRSPRPTRRHLVEAFVRRVFRETGVKLSLGDVARLAGYQTRRWLQAYQRGEYLGPAPMENISRALRSSSDEAVATLDRLRDRENGEAKPAKS